jgi:uncharacterized alkaline shock family protein YloU
MKNEPTPARADGTIAHRSAQSRPGRAILPQEVKLPTPARLEAGQSLVSRRAICQVVRAALASSYGVTGLIDDGILPGILASLRLRPTGVLVRIGDGIRVELRILVAAGVPVAEVARQVDSAVRYAVGQAIGREIEQVTIYVGGLRVEAGSMPQPAPGPDAG